MKYLSLTLFVAFICLCGFSSDDQKNVGADDSLLVAEENRVVAAAVTAYHFDVEQFVQRDCRRYTDPWEIHLRDEARANQAMELFFGGSMTFSEIISKGKDGWNYDIYKVTWVMDNHTFGSHSQTNLYHFNALDQIVEITKGASTHNLLNGATVNSEDDREWWGYKAWCLQNN